MDTVKVVADAFFQNLNAFNGFIKITLVPELVQVSTNFVSSLDPQEVNFSRGSCTLNIVPNSQTGEGSYYKIQIVRRQTIGAGHRDTAIFSGVAVVPDHDCNLSDIITVEPVQPEPIEAAKIYASEAKAAAVQSQTYAEQSGASSTSAENYANMANTASTNAMTYAGNAESAKVSAESARDTAILARVASEEAQVMAVSAKDRAVEAETGALAAQASAESAREAALTAQVGAETARSGAETAQDAAETALAGVDTAIATHNANTEAHPDIRQEIANGGLWLKEEDSIVQFYPVPESKLDVKVNFSLTETPPASGEKSPDNPSTITGVSSAEVVRCGKNLVRSLHSVSTILGVTVTEYDDGTVILNGTSTGNFRLRWWFFPKEYTTLYFNKTLTLSANNDKIVMGASIYIANIPAEVSVLRKYLTTTASKTTAFVTGYFDCCTLAADAGVVFDNLSLKPQLELGSTSTTYTPYEGDTYTIPLGDEYYGGYVDLERGVLVKEWEEVVLDGTENWVQYSQVKCFTLNFPSAIIGLLTSKCTSFINTRDTIWDIPTANFGKYADHPTLQRKYFCWDSPDLDSWKSYLATQYTSGTPVKVAYKLATPVEIPLTTPQILALTQSDKYTPKLNTVYSDQQSVSVGYAKSPIQEHNDITAAIIAAGGSNV